MYDRVLIPVDGSDESKRAARRGLEFARAFDADVDVLHVVERQGLRLTRDDEQGRLEERGETILADVESLASEYERDLETTLAEGVPSERITARANDRDADLVVLGRQGMTGLGKRLLGGVTERVLHRCAVPVFVVPGDGGTTDDGKTLDDVGGYDRVLVPTDGSENAEVATPHGVAVAERFGAELRVLNVVDLQEAGGAFDAGGLQAEFLERLEARGWEAVDRAVADVEAAAPAVTVRGEVERTTSMQGAGGGIREYVAENDVDVVAMASGGRSNIERKLLGSVASTVLRTVDVPLLVVTRSA